MEKATELYLKGYTLLAIGKMLKKDRNNLSKYFKSKGIVSPKMKYKNMSKTLFYGVYSSMKQRCHLKTNSMYHRYGGRGITHDPRWSVFSNFYDDMYESYIEHKKHNKETQLDRINNDGNYCKENCRWATAKEQAKNRLQYKGKENSYQKISKRLGGSHNLVSGRLKKGWSWERATTQLASEYRG